MRLLVRSLRWNRISIRSDDLIDESSCCSGLESGVLSNNHAKRFVSPQQSALESLPQEILIKIVCGVNHGDLKQLLYVSKSIHEAAKIAKELHFAYATPSKVAAAPRNLISSPGELQNREGETENVPNAPLRIARRRRRWCSLDEKKKEDLASIRVALFRSSEEEDLERWPRRKLFHE